MFKGLKKSRVKSEKKAVKNRSVKKSMKRSSKADAKKLVGGGISPAYYNPHRAY